MRSFAPLAPSGSSDVVAFGGPGDVSYATLIRAARAVAAALPPRNDEPGREEVVVLCRDRFLFAAATFGAWEAGYGVALPPNAQEATVRSIRGKPGVRTVLHDSPGARGVEVGAVTTDPVAMAAPADPLSPIPEDRHVVTLYTSGTTGEHRACPKSAAQLLGEVALLLETFGDSRSARILATPPPHHIYGLLFGVLLPAMGGGAFAREAPLDPAELARTLIDGRVDVLVSVPAHLRGLPALADRELPPLRRVFSASAPLLPETAAVLIERSGWNVTEVFGSSETGGIAWRLRTGAAPAPWRPFTGVTVGAGEDHDMMLWSPLLSAATAQPVRCADRVRVDPDGSFEHLGRSDGVLKIGGTRVCVGELEQRLLAIPGVRDAVVVPVEVGGARGFETWAALVAPGLDRPAVRAALLPWFHPVAIPRRYRFLDRLPRASNGKIDRNAALALFDREGHAGSVFSKPLQSVGTNSGRDLGTARITAIVPTYNNPDTIAKVVVGLRRHLDHVVVVDDGSGSAGRAACAALADPDHVHVVHRAVNGGKGAAVKTGLVTARDLGFTHVLQVDADDQHDLGDVPRFLAATREHPEALVLGDPRFDGTAPPSRRIGRRITSFWIRIESGGAGIGDSMCGFRVYPVEAAIRAGARGNAMDFDPEIAVRMVWSGIPVINIPTRVRYLDEGEGGVSHFRLFRDNVLISWLHARLTTQRVVSSFFRALFGRTRALPEQGQ